MENKINEVAKRASCNALILMEEVGGGQSRHEGVGSVVSADIKNDFNNIYSAASNDIGFSLFKHFSP